MRGIRFHGVITSIVLAFLSVTAPALHAEQSSLGLYEAYVEPMYDSYGNKVGIEVHYSVSALMDSSDPAEYSAVCMHDGWDNGAPCVSSDSSARAWTSTYNPYIGYWLTQDIGMNCNASTKTTVQVHQPYVEYSSELNYPRNDQHPNGGDFYSGSSDTITFEIQGCEAQ